MSDDNLSENSSESGESYSSCDTTMANIPPPFQRFDSSKEDFESWLERFTCHLDCYKVTAAEKTNFLIASVGPETYTVMKKISLPKKPKDVEFKTLTEALIQHFNPTPLSAVCRYKFRSRVQGENEDFNLFLAALKELTVGCEFDTDERLEEEIRDRVIAGVRDKSLQSHFFSTPKITFKDVVARGVAAELASKGVQEMHKSETPPVLSPIASSSQPVNKVSETERKKQHKKPKKQNRDRDKNADKNAVIVCYRCGVRDNHKAPECRHKDTKCSKCGKIGHIDKVCGMGRRELLKLVASTKSVTAIPVSQRQIVDIMLSSSKPTVNITPESNPTPKVFINVQVEGKQVHFEVDSGATFTLVSLKEFQRLKIKTPLQPSRYTLRIYDGRLVNTLGYVPVSVKHNSKCYELQLRVVEGDFDNVLGRDWYFPMNLDLRELKSESVQVNKVDIDLQAEIDKLVSEFADIFSDSPGRLPGEPVSFKLRTDANPVFCRARSVPYALRDAVNNEIDRLVREGIYTPTETSDWATPIVPVVKSNGSVRLTGDYSVTLNQFMVPEEYQIPNSEEMLMELEGTVFAKYDFVEAYMHMGTTEECAKLLTVNTPKGLHRVNCINYGVQCAPSKFQRKLEELIRKIPGFKNFFDDVRQASKSPQEHLERMRMFFEVCRANNLRLNKRKCVFATDQLNYLGYTIDANGLHKTTKKIDLILNVQRPTNLDELQSFIGLVGYYSKFIPNFSDVAHPLNQLRRKNVPFVWSNACENAFQKLKQEIASDRVLCHYDPQKELLLSTDASPFALGAVLSHRFPEGERPIAFVSRTLTDTESRYSQLDKEALAIYWGIKKFFNYVYGRKFTLITDCKPLLWIFSLNAAKPALSANRLLHYALFLQGFDYKVIYRRSSEHVNADFASRHPFQTANSSQIDVPTWCHINMINVLPVNAETIAKETLLEPSSASLLAQLRGEETCRIKYNELAKYSIHGDCIMKNDRVYIPASLRQSVLSELHSGHCGIVRCKQLARSYVFWPKMDHDIEEMVAACPTCIKKDPAKEPVHPWQYPSAPWQRIHADIGQVGNDYLLVIVDAYAKWPEGYVLQSTTAKKIISCFEDCFSRFGLPVTLVTDNGPQFASAEFSDFAKMNGINHMFSPPYCPYSNGQAERFIQIVKRGVIADQVGMIDERLQRVLLAYRRNKCAATGKTPASLMFGREIRTRLDLVLPSESTSFSSVPTRRSFNVNDRVHIRMYNSARKWTSGTVSRKLGDVVYLVDDDTGQRHKRHVNQLRKLSARNSATASSTMHQPEIDVLPLPLEFDREPPPNRQAPPEPQLVQLQQPVQPAASPEPQIRRSSRTSRPPRRYSPSSS